MGKVKKITLGLVGVFFTFSMYAQFFPDYYDTLERKHEITLQGGGAFNSTSLQKELTSKFIRGGYITTEIKDASLEEHSRSNRVGVLGSVNLTYANYSSNILKEKWGYVLKAENSIFAGGVYSKDFFGLMMYGNDRYKGEILEASNINFSYTNYQKLGFGIIDKKSKSNVTLNVYNIQNHTNLNLSGLNIYQDSNGDTLAVEMLGTVSLPNNNNINQGIGIGVDFDFYIPILFGKEKEAFVRVQARNIGAAYLYEKQKNYSFDSTIIFTGLEFNQLVGENSLFSSADSIAILDTLGIHSGLKEQWIVLPGYIDVGKIVDEHSTQKLQSFFGIRLMPNLDYGPFVYLGADYRLNSKIRFGINGSYGGFGKFRTGIYSSMKFGNYDIGIASENIFGLISKKGKGQSLFIKLRWQI